MRINPMTTDRTVSDLMATESQATTEQARVPAPVGDSVRRLEDARLLVGAGRFLDDINSPGQLWMRVVRSQVAHGRIVSIDADAARALPGVVAVLTADEIASLGRIHTRQALAVGDFEFALYEPPVLAHDRVRYVGEPVAAVLAETPYLAEDGAELVQVEYEELTPVLDAHAGAQESSPSLRDDAGNVAATITKSYGDVEDAFARAAHVVRTEVSIGRQSGVPLETRGVLAEWDRGRQRFTIGGPLGAHAHQGMLSEMFDLAPTQIHMWPTDVGGDFGSRGGGGVFPEHALVPFAARLLGRPVKWLEDRAEHMVATSHARQQMHRIEAAFDEHGRLLALRDEAWHDKGAYIRPTGVLVSEITVGLLCGPYRVPAYEGTIHAVMTNKTPISPCRAPGRYEGAFARERLLDLASAELGIDPVELRRINLLTTEELPWRPGITIMNEDFVLDSGDFTGIVDKSVEAAGYEDWRAEAEQARAEGRLVGTGIGYFIDKGGLGIYETGAVNVDVGGRIRVLIGGFSVGQGIETVMAQIAASELGVAPDAIEVVYADTELIPDGVGSWGSRSTVTGGGAVLAAATKTADKARRIVAERLEVAPEDLVLADGRVSVAGSPNTGMSLGEVAAACNSVDATERGEEPGLGAREVYISRHMNYPYGVVLAQVEIDRDTGDVDIKRLFMSCEVGRAINPMLVEGQLVGAAFQGVGGALYEEFTYGESGQPLATSFMDYLIPTAIEMPPVEILICEDAPTPDNPLRAKGVGEAGCIGVGAAIAGAIDDAVGTVGGVTRIPISPAEVRALVDGQAAT
jgi:CO/xanthine dehydrogenase Mo-binding subunit